MFHGFGSWHKGTPQLHSKAMVTFKGEWGKLCYTQYTLLSNVRQLPILFFEKQTHTHTHTQGREKGVLTQRHITTPLKSHDNF